MEDHSMDMDEDWNIELDVIIPYSKDEYSVLALTKQLSRFLQHLSPQNRALAVIEWIRSYQATNNQWPSSHTVYNHFAHDQGPGKSHSSAAVSRAHAVDGLPRPGLALKSRKFRRKLSDLPQGKREGDVQRNIQNELLGRQQQDDQES